MRCPHCGRNADRVIDSRESSYGVQTRRRRHCNKCQERWTTYESATSLDTRLLIKRLRAVVLSMKANTKDAAALLKELDAQDV